MNFKKLFKDGKASKGNAMAPLNWFAGIIESGLLSGFIFGPTFFIQCSCLMLIVIILLFYGYCFHYFMKNDPDRLQTEGYNLQSKELTIFGEQLHSTELKSTTGSQQGVMQMVATESPKPVLIDVQDTKALPPKH